MADYIYLLENRLSQSQQNALSTIREIARERGLTVFLVGGAVRDLTSGSPVRDLDVVVQGNALKLKKDLEKAGGVITGEHDAFQALFVRFPGGAKVEIGSTLSVSYPKPGKPVVKPATILDDLRRRDFTANAMAISLNTGSYGLLMDPLNGVADIENRELRLVSNYGFIEDPIRMIRAIRLMARLGWQMDEKTQTRYATGKEEGYISAASGFQRGYETEEIVHEEDPLRVMRGLEAEGWMTILAPQWGSAKANVAELERLRESQTQLQMQGIYPNPATANFPLLTAKLSASEIAELKASFPRQGFVREIEALEAEAKEFAAQFSAKASAQPSQSWKLLHAAKPEAVLQVVHSSKSPAIQAKFKSFYTEWPLAKQKVPYALLQEMRITPELAGYDSFLESVTFELMDGKLDTVEAMKAFLEPFSPPAPPPPVHLRRPRAAKKEAKGSKSRAKKAAPQVESTPKVEGGADTLPVTVVEEQPAKVAPARAEKSAAKKPAETAFPATANVTKPATTKPDVAKAAAAKPDVVKPLSAKKTASIAKPTPKPVQAPKKAAKAIAPAKAVAAKKIAPAKKSAPAKKFAAKAAPKVPTKKLAIKKSAVKPTAKKPAAKKAVAAKIPVKAQAKSGKEAPAKAGAKKKTAVKAPSKGSGKKRR